MFNKPVESTWGSFIVSAVPPLLIACSIEDFETLSPLRVSLDAELIYLSFVSLPELYTPNSDSTRLSKFLISDLRFLSIRLFLR